jgi:formate dehydrogenase major subunit
MTRRTDNLRLLDAERVEVNPSDAERLGVADGDAVAVTSRRGRVRLPADVTDRVAPGELFMSFHFPEALANSLTSDAVDDVTSCPEYKVTAVRLEGL